MHLQQDRIDLRASVFALMDDMIVNEITTRPNLLAIQKVPLAFFRAYSIPLGNTCVRGLMPCDVREKIF